MKQARGAAGVSGEVDDDDDFQVVPVESTSEYDNEIVNMHEQNMHKPQTLLIII